MALSRSLGASIAGTCGVSSEPEAAAAWGTWEDLEELKPMKELGSS